MDVFIKQQFARKFRSSFAALDGHSAHAGCVTRCHHGFDHRDALGSLRNHQPRSVPVLRFSAFDDTADRSTRKTWRSRQKGSTAKVTGDRIMVPADKHDQALRDPQLTTSSFFPPIPKADFDDMHQA